MSKEFTKSYAINRIAELNEQIVEMTDNQNQTMRYLNRIRDENNQLKQQLAEKDKRIAELENENGYILFEDGYDENGKEVHRQVYTTYQQAFNEQVLETKKLRRQLKEKDKEIESLKQQLEETNAGYDFTYEQSRETIKELKQNQTQLAIQELEKVNGILTDTIIEVTQDEFDLNKLCYLEEISARFYEKIQQQIKELKGE